MDNDICVVFLCNKAYFNKFQYTCNLLVTKGNYKGNICLVVGDELNNNELLDCSFIKNNNISVKYFPNIQFTKEFLEINDKIRSDGRNKTKSFQWHKLHLFNSFFKQWKYIFYMDCGITIFSDIGPILNERTENSLLAHSDAYPKYVWKLYCQFDATNTEYFSKLIDKYNMDIDYFQTTIMLYDTNIINDETFNDLLSLTYQYPICKTNEQGIMALYFTNIKPVFKQIKIANDCTHFYDYLTRNKNNKYIMLKSI